MSPSYVGYVEEVQILFLEMYIEGKWVKFNNNYGWVNNELQKSNDEDELNFFHIV